MLYFTKTPRWLRLLHPSAVWNMPRDQQKIYLTFDDGPHGGSTPFVLEQLRQYQARATFFCIGKNVLAEPALYKNILMEGHRVGNHTMEHRNGWKTPDKVYLNDIEKARTLIDSDLFRPPYGRITPFQADNLVRILKYKLIMWDVLSGDFDPKVNGAEAARRVTKYASAGSIVVFHNSAKSFDTLRESLPIVLQHFSDLGYQFEAIV